MSKEEGCTPGKDDLPMLSWKPLLGAQGSQEGGVSGPRDYRRPSAFTNTSQTVLRRLKELLLPPPSPPQHHRFPPYTRPGNLRILCWGKGELPGESLRLGRAPFPGWGESSSCSSAAVFLPCSSLSMEIKATAQ